ncbi:MAG: porin [Rhodocyclaceae bacterium]|nr:porin [Rhodocyclaceae bacterium]
MSWMIDLNHVLISAAQYDASIMVSRLCSNSCPGSSNATFLGLMMTFTLPGRGLTTGLAICLASMFLAGNAGAQGSSAMYGTVDVCAMHSTNGSGSKRSGIESGCHDASVIGWRIQEAISPGLNAIARLEYGLAVDQNSGIGAPSFGSRTLSRQGYVGISGDYGTVTAGRMSSPVKIMQYFDPVGGSVFSGLLVLLPTPLNSRADPTHFSNAVRYMSPVLGGWQHFVVYAFAPYGGDDKTYASNQERATLIATYYHGEQLAFFAGTQLTQHLGNAPPIAIHDSSAALSWTLDRVKIAGIFVRTERSGGAIVGGSNKRTFDQSNLGLQYHLSEIDSIGIQVSHLHDHNLDQADSTSMGLIVEHALSKRTLLYAGYNLTLNDDTTQFSADTFNRPTPGATAKLVGAGIRHNF